MTADQLALRFDNVQHRAWKGEREYVRVTTALTDVGLIDARWFTAESRERGTAVHLAAQEFLSRDGPLVVSDEIAGLVDAQCPYVAGFCRFLDDTNFLPIRVEQPVSDDTLFYAGCPDAVGVLEGLWQGPLDLIDLKTGTAPDYVGIQTMLYRRCLPPTPPVRRWALELPGNGRYRLIPLNLTADRKRIDRKADQVHEQLGLAAVLLSRWKRGI